MQSASTGLAGTPVDTLPSYGDPVHLGVAAFVLVAILLITKYGSGFIANIAVLLGIVLGCVRRHGDRKMHFGKVADAPWFGLVLPFHFGMPIFDPVAIVTMCLVMIVVMIESLGMFLAIGNMTGRGLSRDDLTRGLRRMVSAPSSAACSTRFPTPRSRRMSGSSASPGCARAMSAWSGVSSCCCSA